MERLTRKIAGSVALPLIPMDIKHKADLEIYHKVRKQYEENTIKLAEYEDFEEIFRAKMTDTACEFLKDKEEFGKWLDRNKWIAKKCDEYARAEEQGLLLRLPVPIGTTVYKFEPLAKGTERYIKTTITRYEVFGDSIWFTFANGLGRNIEDFGKYVFLTQAEAEQKLKAMESGEDNEG